VSKKFLKASDVARQYGVSSVSVRSWIKRGLLPNAKLEQTVAGSIWLIPEGDLKNFKQPEKGRPPRKKQNK
jgi:uncharacterized protein YjcR